MTPLTHDDILQSFSTRQRKLVKLPPLDGVDWQACDFLGWIHPSGHLGFILAESPAGLTGLALRRSAILRGTRPRRLLCSLCLTVHGDGGVSSFALNRAQKDSYLTKADMFCSDLRCSDYVRGRRKSEAVQMPETLSETDKIARLQANLQSYLQRVAALRG
jgi:FBP C-terminal treble-clef zinc-finger